MWGDPLLMKVEQFLDRPVQWFTAARPTFIFKKNFKELQRRLRWHTSKSRMRNAVRSMTSFRLFIVVLNIMREDLHGFV